MKKLKLSLDQLSVETFRVEDERHDLGTVHGRQDEATAPPPDEQAGFWSWLVGSCDHTCKISCPPPNHTQCAGGFCYTYQCVPTTVNPGDEGPGTVVGA